MKKNDIVQWRELCGKIKMLNHQCKDCRHGGDHADYPGNCPRHLPACLSFEPAASTVKSYTKKAISGDMAERQAHNGCTHHGGKNTKIFQ